MVRMATCRRGHREGASFGDVPSHDIRHSLVSIWDCWGGRTPIPLVSRTLGPRQRWRTGHLDIDKVIREGVQQSPSVYLLTFKNDRGSGRWNAEYMNKSWPKLDLATSMH